MTGSLEEAEMKGYQRGVKETIAKLDFIKDSLKNRNNPSHEFVAALSIMIRTALLKSEQPGEFDLTDEQIQELQFKAMMEKEP